jgi:tRNA pseudouridine65 synthase
MLEILYDTADLVAINKPHGLLVHRSPIAADATEFAVQMLRDQIGQKVFPIHRLDRKTAGILLFAKHQEALVEMSKLFEERRIQKEYEALVRGYCPQEGIIDYPLSENGKEKEAISKFERIRYFEVPIPLGKHPTSRYTLVRIWPMTGRFHQIRKHFAHIFHPIIGDRPHGCNKQNGLWKNTFGFSHLFLQATKLSWHEHAGNYIEIKAEWSEEMKAGITFLESFT